LLGISAQTIGLWIQGTAIVASAIGVIAIVLTHRVIARKKATIDYLIFTETNDELVRLRREFVKLKNAGNLEQYAARDKIPSAEATTIRKIANQYEIIAIALKHKAFHADLFKMWWRSSLVADWIAIKNFANIYQREHYHLLFKEFELLAKKWATEHERKHT
jgi:hypothetical protein